MIDFFSLHAYTDYIDPAAFAPPIYFICMGIEAYLASRQNMEVYDKRDTKANLLLGLGFSVLVLICKLIFYYIFSFVYQYRIFNIPNVWWAWIVLLFADDFTYYWYHRLHHKVRILWAAHVVHHSTKNLNLSTPFREPLTIVFYYNFFWLWLPFLGFQPWMVLCMMSMSLMYQFWTHSTLIGKLGFIEWVMITPSHHRVHHASNIQYLDKNHGAVFVIWDKLFGTFKEEEEKPVYGLTKDIHAYDMLTINFHEYSSLLQDFKKADTIAGKIKYLFYPPGWSCDGSSKTAKQMQEEIYSSKQV